MIVELTINNINTIGMPFVFKFQVRDSQIQGKGVFALEDIPADTIFWVFQVENPIPVVGHVVRPNLALSREQMEAMTHEELQDAFRGGLFMEKSQLFLYFRDGTQFTNHSPDSNTETIYPTSGDYKDMVIKTTKALKAGDEIFECYSNAHKPITCPWLKALVQIHYPDRITFQKELFPGAHDQ